MTDAMSKPENETASMCLDRIVVLERELAESRAEGLEQARLLGISGSREARLLAEIERLKEALEWYVSCRARELLKEKP